MKEKKVTKENSWGREEQALMVILELKSYLIPAGPLCQPPPGATVSKDSALLFPD